MSSENAQPDSEVMEPTLWRKNGWFVKTASEVLDRSARQRDHSLNKRLSVAWEGRWFEVRLELVPDEYESHALLSAVDDAGATVAKHRVSAGFKFNRDVANEWVRGGFAEP
jgi:hypothetical protein